MTPLSARAAALRPYTAGEQPKDKRLIKLNTNENPYPPSPKAVAAARAFDFAALRLYPDPTALELRKAIAAREGVSVENVFAGNGSDEVLSFAFYALFDAAVAYADVTYSFYPVYCRFYGISDIILPLADGFTLDPADYIKKNYGGIVIANPNAPTSLLCPRGFIEDVCKTNSCNVIVDEAYIDFAPPDSSAVPLINRYGNLLVVKTFSKSYSLAGIRCGYAIGAAHLIDALFKVKDSFNSYPLDALCQTIAAAAVSDSVYFNAARQGVSATRDKTASALKKSGFTVLDSAANFLFVKSGKGLSGQKLYGDLRANGVLVRRFDAPRTADYIRVSVGSDADMELFLAAISEI
ncbi:MAG: aminotransferase class I/II-fold pyridoxal phosphate-dependent enzyme [Clostridiales bacterium]|jgi:histidinol-phosphate aminotransferase|nr:aminotransferase class I/II-fold pyridoxal phosphate-dependent enzyme [Clostridiales bacterium]